MKVSTKALFYSMFLVFGLIVFAPFASSKGLSVNAQNRISGFIFGLNRQPMADLNVELFDNYGSTIGRTRTTGSGYYNFVTMTSGVLIIKVYTFRTDYEEQEITIEIQNTSVSTSSGGTRRSGFSSELVDFYLKLRRGVSPTNAVVFAQDVPPEAKKLYEKAVADLDNKRNAEALSALKAALEIFPKYYVALERLGTEYINLGRPEAFQAAAILFTNAVDVHPRGFRSWYGLAYARYSLGNFPEALTAVQKAIELNAYSADSFFLSGVLMKKTQKYDVAEKQLLKAKELSKDTIASVHWELATLYGNVLNRYSDAAKELKLFLKAQPDSKDAEKIKKLIADFEAKAQTK